MLPPHIRFGSVGTLELYADEYGILQSCESWVVGSFRVATTRKLTHYRILASLRQPGASLSPRCACRISVSVIKVTLTPLAGTVFPVSLLIQFVGAPASESGSAVSTVGFSFPGVDELCNFGVEQCVSTADHILKTGHL